MSGRKAQTSLEYIAKMLIIVVVVAVVIGMIYTFSGDIKEILINILGPHKPPEEKPPPIAVEGPFYASDVANLIETCWVEKRDAEDDRICFVLEGPYNDNAATAESDIINLLEPEIKNNVEFDADFVNDDFFSINYRIIGRKIRVKS
ncbi:MAG: hypothetical protein U9Q92_07825 [archaeon]|nr:hypothetical protein [archaeon]